MERGERHKVFKLTANSNYEMQNSISLCTVGDEVDYEYDVEKNKYSASSDSGDIGFFPKAAEELLDDQPAIYISNIDTNDNGNYVVSVAMFPK